MKKKREKHNFVINNVFVIHKQAITSDGNRRFVVFMTHGQVKVTIIIRNSASSIKRYTRFI